MEKRIEERRRCWFAAVLSVFLESAHSQMAFFGVFPIPIQMLPGPEKSVMAKSEIAALVDDRVEPGVGKMFISFALQIRYTSTTTPIALELQHIANTSETATWARWRGGGGRLVLYAEREGCHCYCGPGCYITSILVTDVRPIPVECMIKYY